MVNDIPQRLYEPTCEQVVVLTTIYHAENTLTQLSRTGEMRKINRDGEDGGTEITVKLAASALHTIVNRVPDETGYRYHGRFSHDRYSKRLERSISQIVTFLYEFDQ